MKSLALLFIAGIALAQPPPAFVAGTPATASAMNTTLADLYNRSTHKFSGSGVPGSITYSTRGDIYINTANDDFYICDAASPPCTSVASGNWVLKGNGGGGGGGSVFTGSTAISSAFSATPTFSLADVSVKSPIRFESGALTANVTSVTFSNKTAGAAFSIAWPQDGTGGRTVSYGASASGTCTIDTTANATTTQFFQVKTDGSTVVGVGCVTTSTVDGGPEQAAPGTPATSTGVCWWDSTNHVRTCMDNNASTKYIMVQPLTCGGGNVFDGLSAAGVFDCVAGGGGGGGAGNSSIQIYPAGSCNGAGVGVTSLWSTDGSSNPSDQTSMCLNNATGQLGSPQRFTTTSKTAALTFPLQSLTADITIYGYQADGSTGVAGFQIRTSCPTASGTPTLNTAQQTNTQTNPSTNTIYAFTVSSITTTGCSVGSPMMIQIKRGSADTYAGTDLRVLYVKVTSHGAPDAAGSDTQVTFNDGGSTAGDPGMVYDKTSGTLTGTFLEATTALYASAFLPESDSTGLFMSIVGAGNSGYEDIKGVSFANCGTFGSTNEKCQTAHEINAMVDSSNKYGNGDIRFSLHNPSASSPFFSAFSVGMEGNYSNAGTATPIRLYFYDYLNADTPFFIEADNKTVDIGSAYVLNGNDAIFSGEVVTPLIFSGFGASGVMVIQSTFNASTSADRIDFKVGNSGAPVTAFQLTHAGAALFSTLKTTGSAGSKKVVCVDTSTGQIYASSTGTDCSN